jgi:O-antigen ligase
MVVASTVTLFVFGFPVVLADLGPGPLFYYRLLVFPADLGLAATAAAVAFAVVRGQRPRLGTMLLALLTAALAVALAFHPSPQGVQTVLRFAGATALAFAVSAFSRDERLLAVGTLAVLTVTQIGLGVAQLVNGGPLGLPSFGEVADPLRDFAGALGPRGTMHGQYVLAGLGLVSALLLIREGLERGSRVPFVLAGIASIAVGMTFSRAAAGALVLACVVLAAGAPERRRAVAVAILCLVAGAGIPALLLAPGWVDRASISLRGRDTLVEESLGLIADSPLVGIGPGRTLFVLPLRYPDVPEIGYQPVHDLPLLATVEGGLVAGGLAVALLGTLAWRARRDVAAAALFVAFLPPVLLDHYTYTYLQGVVLLAVWVGALDGLAARAAPVLAPHPRVLAIFARLRPAAGARAPMRTSRPPRTA